MSDRFRPISFDRLVSWIFSELDARGSVLGIPRELFWTPPRLVRSATEVYRQRLANPFGVAAGPHSQMAQNIVVAWLCGARFIELKTVQTLDRLEISKPCIDMHDEGYNVEWSQELTLDESFEEYLRAWVLIHALHRRLELPGDGPGTIFNLSVGYDLAGILQPNMQRFLDRARDLGPQLADHVSTVLRHYPELGELDVPARLSDNVTLSTMHGCPPDEIGRIAAFLMHDRGLHTAVKLNPTLLGPEPVRHILSDVLGYAHITVPDIAFEHDLKHADAIDLLAELERQAATAGVDLAVKLSNTLQVEHHGEVFDPSEQSMYLSGRPLHALTVQLAHRLAVDHRGDLAMSFAGGADAHNVAHLLACGMTTVTSCSDLLRPGGYTRLGQYLSATDEAFNAVGASSLDDYIRRAAGVVSGAADPAALPAHRTTRDCARVNLEQYAARVLHDPLLQRRTFDRANTSTKRTLGLFDCIVAPCVDACPIEQRVPEYMRLVEAGRFTDAAAVIRADNPLGATLGRACTHVCEGPCTRTHYDEPLAIREIKRFVMDRADVPCDRPDAAPRLAKVAIIGGGPCGLAAASILAPAGYQVTIFDTHDVPGGMVSDTIPGFRARPAALEQDLQRLVSLGVDLRTGRTVHLGDVRRERFELVIVAAGAQRGRRLGIAGEQSHGVLDGLDLLRAVRRGQSPTLGDRVGVIGGGDVAMDCARTARRLGARQVSILYRRTRAEMPAHAEELDALVDEGIEIVELVAPLAVEAHEGRITALRCAQMQLGPPDASGRPRPQRVPGAELALTLDTLAVAVGQDADLAFLGDAPLRRLDSGYLEVDPETLETAVSGVYAGGDVVRGPATIVEAVADGRRIAGAIRRRVEEWHPEPPSQPTADVVELLRRRARRERRVPIPQADPSARGGFAEVVATLSEDDAVREASRCLACDALCSTCVTVCPNRALMTLPCAGLQACLPTWRRRGGSLAPGDERGFRVSQPHQVIVLADLCNECGNCSAFCPTTGHPYRDKPRLYLDAADFQAQADNAFMVESHGQEWTAAAKIGGELHRIWLDEEVRYRSPQLEARLDPGTLRVIEARPSRDGTDGAEITLDPCATLLVLVNSLREGAPEIAAPPQALLRISLVRD